MNLLYIIALSWFGLSIVATVFALRLCSLWDREDDTDQKAYGEIK